MNVREMKASDIEKCAEILCAVYNNELWMCRWDKKSFHCRVRANPEGLF